MGERVGGHVLNNHVFGKRLTAARVLAEYSVPDLAKAVTEAGVYTSPDMIWAYERGDRYPSVPQLDIIMRLIGVTFDYFDED